jgi:stage II sporulation protein D
MPYSWLRPDITGRNRISTLVEQLSLRCSGVQVFRYSGIQVFRCSGNTHCSTGVGRTGILFSENFARVKFETGGDTCALWTGRDACPIRSIAAPLLRNGIRGVCVSLVLLLFLAPVLHADKLPVTLTLPTSVVRVHLTRCANAKPLTLRSETGARLSDQNGEVVAEGSGPWTLSIAGKCAKVCDADGRTVRVVKEGELLRLQGEDAETRVRVAVAGEALRSYHGGLAVRVAAGKWMVLNEVALETYLRGVVASEMGGGAPLEALKAQAVAARTFALYRLLNRKTPGDFDLRDDTQDQAYKGADVESPVCDRAVRETQGQILTREGRPVAALYCADCGGVTAPGENLRDFPRSVSDADAHGSPEHPRTPPWTLRCTPDVLKTLLNKTPALRLPGKLESLEPLEQDSSGRVTRLCINDETGASCEITGAALRVLLGVNKFRSTLFTVTREPTGEFLFTGRGWGHGRGLCQTGAMALAAAPLSQRYGTILKRYYAGAVLTKVQYGDPME